MGKKYFLIVILSIKKLFFDKKAYFWLSKQLSVNKRIKMTKSICKNKLTYRLAYEISLITYSMGYKHYLIVITLLERLCFSFKESLFFILSKNIVSKPKHDEILM